jgi:hypothetical protein
MSVLKIRQAQRAGARLVIVLAGQTGDGKTLSALLLAYGLAGFNPAKVGFLDTENGRGSLYANELREATPPSDVPFLIGDLEPPFSPDRYKAAILEFQAAGVEALVVDSATHEWEGTGGCEEIAADTNGRVADWKKAKRLHKSFMNAALQCDMHIIFCVRAREKTDFTDPKKPVALGVQPIQEKNFMFEATASMMMKDAGRARDVIKCPKDLIAIFGDKGPQKGYLTPDMGFALREWVAGGVEIDPEVERYRNRLRSNAEGGLAHIDACILKVPAKVRKALGVDWLETVRASATAFDATRSPSSDAPAGVASLQAQIATAGAADDQDPV